jgi:hypothetical protein
MTTAEAVEEKPIFEYVITPNEKRGRKKKHRKGPKVATSDAEMMSIDNSVDYSKERFTVPLLEHSPSAS